MAEDRMLSDEVLLALIKKNSGGGGSGTNNYNDLSNQPKINGNTLIGNKTASDLGLVAAETGKGLSSNNYTDEDKAIVGGVTAALAGKQGVLTAGNHVSIANDGTINVTQGIGVYDVYFYELMSIENGLKIQLTKKINNVTISTQVIANIDYSPTNKLTVDDLFDLWYDLSNFYWHYKLLVDSKEHQKNEEISWYYTTMADYTETFDVSQDSSTDLATKGDVEIALANKQDKTDNALQTTDKTVVGAVNELKSGLTNYQAQNDLNLEVPNRKNILPMTVDIIKSLNTSGTWSGNSYTFFGVTYTVSTNSDGYVTSVALSGTASGGGGLELGSYTASDYAGKIMSGCPSGGSKGTFYLYGQWSDTNHGWIHESDDIGSGCILEYNSGDVYFEPQIYVKKGTNVSGKTFYPMVRPDFITNSTFAPYIPSVDARLDAVESGLTNRPGTISLEASGKVTSIGGYADRNGQMCVLNIALVMSAQETTNWISLGTVPPPTHIIRADIISDSPTSVGTLRVQIEADGTFKVFYGGNGEYRIVIAYLISSGS